MCITHDRAPSVIPIIQTQHSDDVSTMSQGGKWGLRVVIHSHRTSPLIVILTVFFSCSLRFHSGTSPSSCASW